MVFNLATTMTNTTKKNFKYGKLENGDLIYAPYYLVIGNKTYVNAPAKKYLSAGWKLIVEGEIPQLTDREIEEGWYIVAHYTEDETSIYISYSKERNA